MSGEGSETFGGAGHRLLLAAEVVGQGPGPGHARGGGLAAAGAHLAGQHQAGQAAVAGRAGHAGHDLAAQGLEVEGALAGDHQVGVVERGVQADQAVDQRDTRLAPAAQRQDRGAQATGGAGTRPGREAGRAGGELLQHAGPPFQGAVQQHDVFAGGALLRTVHVRRPVQAGQRVVHVGRGDDLHVAQPGRVAQRRHRDQGRPAVGQRVPRLVHRRCAQRGEHAGAAVVRRGAAQPDHDRAGAVLDRVGDEDPQAVRGGPAHVTLGAVDEVQAARLGALHVRGVAHDQHRPARRAPQRVDRLHRHQAPGQGRGQDVHEARPAVRQRAAHDLVGGHGREPAVGDRGDDLRRGERAGELVRADQYAHESAVWQDTAPDLHAGAK
ncbi:hypothetical protein Psuf_013200 [Phytohabitans suffuscus]|uniref:Uncharacterized protein n=1 Tax=Phytohabitans suffuscus TaxID=624315 RepID=A0A6F8YD70_9ACTN|nr:hypothetical protein Psuf_013200 [Phytohabitans suffuscus]